jgi:hypothetical protein
LPGCEPDAPLGTDTDAYHAWARKVGEREGHEDRVEGVVAVIAAAHDGERQVELRGREPDDRRQPPERIAHAGAGRPLVAWL